MSDASIPQDIARVRSNIEQWDAGLRDGDEHTIRGVRDRIKLVVDISDASTLRFFLAALSLLPTELESRQRTFSDNPNQE